MTEVITTPKAERDIERAIRWYQQRSPAAARDFGIELFDAIERVGQFPEAFPRVGKSYRFIRIRRYSYVIVYRPLGVIAVIEAVIHTRRSAKAWKRWRK